VKSVLVEKYGGKRDDHFLRMNFFIDGLFFRVILEGRN